MQVGVHKVPMAQPGDVSELARLIDAGTIDPATIVAVIGKTEGNGGANDFTRGYATLAHQLLLSRHLGLPTDEIGRRVAFVWSGGTEGVLSPHATIFTRTDSATAANDDARLALSVETTRDIAPEEIGTPAVVDEVAAAVRRAVRAAGIRDPRDVHYVQVKGPLLTPAGLADADRRGVSLVTRDPNGSKAFARGSMALGVAVGLGEVSEAALADGVILNRPDLFSSVASTSAGGELRNCEVVLLGNAPPSSGAFRIGHAVLQDAVDADGVRAALRCGGLEFDCNPSEEQARRITSVFAKAAVSPSGMIRGRRTTMLSDADINYERHARAALGGVIASITRDPAIFVSGGTEHQCPPGAAPIAAIVQV
jgi:cyanuric acid amidohydrolase